MAQQDPGAATRIIFVSLPKLFPAKWVGLVLGTAQSLGVNARVYHGIPNSPPPQTSNVEYKHAVVRHDLRNFPLQRAEGIFHFLDLLFRGRVFEFEGHDVTQFAVLGRRVRRQRIHGDDDSDDQEE